MAVLSKDKTYVTVEKGDTLSEIARDYGNGKTYKQLASLNKISNPDLIYVGQKVVLSGVATSTTASDSSVATINHFGIQSNSDNTIFATWEWGKSHTENYEAEWYYDTGDGVWFVGSKSTTEDKQSTYSIPNNAKRVKFRVKPVSEKYTANEQETSYWTASWSTVKIHDTSDNPPSKPSTPSVTIEKYQLTAELDNLDVNATDIQFQVVKDNNSVYKTGMSAIMTGHASYSCTVDAGGEYKVRCRSHKDKKYSEWSDYSSNVSTIPSASSGITVLKATSESSVYLEWSGVNTAESYDIEYTTKKEYFDGSDKVSNVSGIEFTHYEKTGLEAGEEYFFRVRAVNSEGHSAWSGIKSIVIGKKPAAPTTWSSTTTVITGEPLTLYWMHNAEDGSDQTYAELELYINEVKSTYTIQSSSEEEKTTGSYVVNTSDYIEGTRIQWRVRTAGITKVYGDWSIQRTVDIYAPPNLELSVTDVKGNPVDILESFPFYVRGLASPNTQAPIGYHLSIVSNEIYDTVDSVGNAKTVNNGEEVYSKYFDISDLLLVEFSPSNIDLENNVSYSVRCTVSMNSGLTASAESEFTVSWTDLRYSPNAEISIDADSIAAHIHPYCEDIRLVFYKVNYGSLKYTITSEEVEIVEGVPLEGAYSSDVYTITGEQVFTGTTATGDSVFYCTVEKRALAEGVKLSVYRREFDGSFTEIATGLNNLSNTFVTDPHPSLDYARYRIVAITESTGAVSYYDVPGYPVGESAVIIQWDEEWTSFDTTNEDEMEQPPWSGSMLKLPYNIDVSDKHSSDVSLVEYIGRKYPVSYYGTHLGETSSWNVVIPKDDRETLYALRRLAIWMGDVYVREPSGSGYWAHISVSFDQRHKELTIPVAMSITRVEGGI